MGMIEIPDSSDRSRRANPSILRTNRILANGTAGVGAHVGVGGTTTNPTRRRERRTSFSEDNPRHHKKSGERGLLHVELQPMMSSINDSSVSETEAPDSAYYDRAGGGGGGTGGGIQGHGHNRGKYGKKNNHHNKSRKPFWQVARPQIEVTSTARHDWVRMANTLERSVSHRTCTLNGDQNHHTAAGHGPRAGAILKRPTCCHSNAFARTIVKSAPWNILVILFTFVLMFGSPVQFFADSQAKSIFDALFGVAMVYLVVDIALTAFADAAYFPLYWKSWKDFECGSFLFWFDVIGVGSMVYNLWKGAEVGPKWLEITGGGSDNNNNEYQYNKHQEGRVNLVLLCTVILRTVRIARFLSIVSVVKFASNVNSKARWIFSRYRYEQLKKFAFFVWCKSLCLCRIHIIPTAQSNLSGTNAGGGGGTAANKFRTAVKTMRIAEPASGGGAPNGAGAAGGVGGLRSSMIGATGTAEDAAQTIQDMWRNYKDIQTFSEKKLRTKKRLAMLRRQERRGSRMSLNVSHESGGSYGYGGYGSGYGYGSGSASYPLPSPSSRAKSRKAIPRVSEIGLAMNYITTKRVAVGVVVSMCLPLFFTTRDLDMTNSKTMMALHNNLVAWHNNTVASALTGAGAGANANAFSAAGAATATATASFQKDSMEFVKTAFPGESSRQKLLYLSFHNHNRSANTNSNSRRILNSNTSSRLDQHGHADPIIIVNEGMNLHATTRNISVTTVDEFTHVEYTTLGSFDARNARTKVGEASLCFVIFFLIIYFFGLLSFAGPITTLVVIPIERMIRLLNMLVKEPLGYENLPEFKNFVQEQDHLATHTFFTKDNLKGMETEFLINSILRIGSLMKVGFGAAGVQIIRDSTKKKKKTVLKVNCIFLFCDIRQFTDTSECLQEEIFLFTNKIAEVVHSICHSFGGFADQNKGDAFLVVWKLDSDNDINASGNQIDARRKEADSAMYSVVQICMAMNYESFFLDNIDNEAVEKLKEKFKNRKGNMIQIGFGLHAGEAVEGAIGSTRKLDATYLSREVDLAEFLESSTKKYGANLLMSGKFHGLLHRRNKEQCRQVDEAFFPEEMDEDFDIELFMIPEEENEAYMRIYAYDFDLEVLRNQRNDQNDDAVSDSQLSMDPSEKSFGHGHSGGKEVSFRLSQRNMGSRKSIFGKNICSKRKPGKAHFMRRMSIIRIGGPVQEPIREEVGGERATGGKRTSMVDELILPTGPTQYDHNLWKADNIVRMRQKYNMPFLVRFRFGLILYLEGRWKEARTHFKYLVQHHNDKPSQVLLEKMQTFNNIPGYKFRVRLGIQKG